MAYRTPQTILTARFTCCVSEVDLKTASMLELLDEHDIAYVGDEPRQVRKVGAAHKTADISF